MQGLVVGRYIFTDTSKREGGALFSGLWHRKPPDPGYGKAGSQNIIP